MGESLLLTASVGYCMQHRPLLAVPCAHRGPQRVLEGGRTLQQQQQRLLELECSQRPVQPVHALAAIVS